MKNNIIETTLLSGVLWDKFGKMVYIDVPENNLNIMTGEYSNDDLAELLRACKNNPEQIQFIADKIGAECGSNLTDKSCVCSICGTTYSDEDEVEKCYEPKKRAGERC